MKFQWAGLLMIGLLTGDAASAEVKVFTRSLKDATHIELSGLNEWRYDKSQVSETGVVVVQFDSVTPEELAPLKGLKDSRVSSVEIEKGINNSARVKFKLRGRHMQLFDYQTEAPVTLVLDIYKEEGSKTKVSAEQNRKNVLASIVAPEPKKKAGKSRKTASDGNPQIVDANLPPLLNSTPIDAQLKLQYGIFDGGDKDLKRFKISDTEFRESALIKSRENIYLKFPEVIVDHPYLNELLASPIQHEVPKKNGEENQLVRMMIKLFKDDKPVLVLKTLKFFREKFPTSEYDKIIAFLEADTYYKIWQRDHQNADLEVALSRYKGLLKDYPNDESRYRTLMLIGLSYLDVKNNLGALTTFQKGMQIYPESPYFWQMRMAVAEALRALNKSETALDELESIEKDPNSKVYGIEARFRRGDVYFKQGNYADAIKEYTAAITKYPTHLATAPNVFFNAAEAQFWLKDYKGSLESYRGFLQRFPSHPSGGYAMTRIGEILELLGAPKQKVTGAFLESFFRYRGSPGAYLARVYINTDRFADMKEKELAAVRKEFVEEKPKDKIEHLDSFLTLRESDGFLARKNYKQSLDMLVNYYQAETISPFLPIFKNRITYNLTTQMKTHNANAEYIKSLEVFLKNSENWFAKNNRIDTHFIAAQSYEGLNLLDEAKGFYQKCLNDFKALNGDQLKYSRVFEYLPTEDQLHLRLAKVNLESGDVKSAGEHLSEIKNVERMTEIEQVERSLVLAAVAEKQERFDLAIVALKDLVEHWKGQPGLLAEPWYRLAKIFRETKKTDQATEWAKKVVETGTEHTETVKPETIRSSLELLAEVYLQEKRPNEAAEAYRLILDKHHADKPTGSVRYRLGKIFFDQKKLRDATNTWQWPKTDKDAALWSKMAQEQLAQVEWTDKYKKYVDRKPAGGK